MSQASAIRGTVAPSAAFFPQITIATTASHVGCPVALAETSSLATTIASRCTRHLFKKGRPHVVMELRDNERLCSSFNKRAVSLKAQRLSDRREQNYFNYISYLISST